MLYQGSVSFIFFSISLLFFVVTLDPVRTSSLYQSTRKSSSLRSRESRTNTHQFLPPLHRPSGIEPSVPFCWLKTTLPVAPSDQRDATRAPSRRKHGGELESQAVGLRWEATASTAMTHVECEQWLSVILPVAQSTI